MSNMRTGNDTKCESGDEIKIKEPANGVKNKNKPKCVNCLRHLCNAGKVNHGTHKDMTENGFNRTQCLFFCGCVLFEEYKNRAPQ